LYYLLSPPMAGDSPTAQWVEEALFPKATELASIEFQRAGERAMKRRAYRESEQHYRTAIALVHTLPESPELNHRELTLQLTLGEMMGATQGYSSPERSAAFTRARVLAERAGGPEALMVFFGLCGAAHTRGEQRSALALADQALEIATNIGTPAALSRAYYWQALPLVFKWATSAEPASTLSSH
jgi:hypothetical protein